MPRESTIRVGRIGSLGAACLLGAGCSSEGIAQGILETHFFDILLHTTGYLVAGGVLGFLLGILGYFVVKRAGGYAWEWRFAKWVRRLAALLIVLTTTSAGSVAGGCIGLAAGMESFLTKGEQAHATLTKAGEPMADFAFYLLVVSERHVAAANAELAAKERGQAWDPVGSEALFELPTRELEAFQGGEAISSARVEDLAERLPYRAGGETFAEAVDEVMGVPEGEDPGLRHVLLKEGMAFLIKHGLEREAKASSGKGAIQILKRSLDLSLASAREGDADLITRPELAQHFADELYAPLIVLTLKRLLIPYRWGSYALLILAPLLPIPLFWLARYVARRRAAARLLDEESAGGEAGPKETPPEAPESPREPPPAPPEGDGGTAS